MKEQSKFKDIKWSFFKDDICLHTIEFANGLQKKIVLRIQLNQSANVLSMVYNMCVRVREREREREREKEMKIYIWKVICEKKNPSKICYGHYKLLST